MNELLYIAAGAGCMAYFIYFCLSIVSIPFKNKKGELFDRCSFLVGMIAMLSTVALLIAAVALKE
jgi:hypothetical protein